MSGKVTTFYSFKGGNGRSMSMANVAWALATNGERVLAIDWDLEAPGLHRYFHPFLRDPEQLETLGLVDHIWSYIQYRANTSIEPSDLPNLAKADGIVQELDLPLRKSKGVLHFIGAGRQDAHYSAKVGGLDWSTFYGRFGGRTYLDAMLDWARHHYTHILIDSRTGLADTAGVCTTQLPDSLVLFLVYNRQSIEGTAAVAQSIVRTRRESQQPPIEMLVCPSRVEERGTVESARRYTVNRLAPALQRPRAPLTNDIRRNEIRHYPWCAFEEKLAVFEDEPDERGSLLDAMHILAWRVAGSDARRKIKPVTFDEETIQRYWRRAAFDDPRLAELQDLSNSAASEVVAKLVPWLEEALDTPEDRVDWLGHLAEACVERTAALGEAMDPDAADFLSDAGVELARIVHEREGRDFRTRFAYVLQSRSDYMQQRGDLIGALGIAEEAVSLYGRDKTSLAQWRQLRALERVAELQDALGASGQAIDTYRMMVERSERLNRRELPLGGEVEGLRARRLLAEKLLARGEADEALSVLEPAIRRLPVYRNGSRLRDSAEVANIVGLYVEAAMAIDLERGREAMTRARQYLPEIAETRGARAALERRLAMAQAEGLRRSGHPMEALSALDALDDENRRSVAALETRAAILLDLDRPQEAQRFLMEAVSRGGASLSASALTSIERVVTGTKDPVLLMEMILNQRSARRSPAESEDLLRMMDRVARILPEESAQIIRALKKHLAVDLHGRTVTRGVDQP
ncbi:hypothetical protein [Devosia sp. 1635]|uniref:KGGVGR-motif variant AAA ATPase n=1 Tax=Devosia sp. 1635 TaxID=2726066 RepID=UPI0015655594|nr:hypothetical protein [Devosia sp. 1635]